MRRLRLPLYDDQHRDHRVHGDPYGSSVASVLSVFIVAATFVVVAAPALAQSDFHWNGRLAPGQTIEIKGVNGTVQASAANSNEVEVTATKSARRSNPADVRIDVVPHGGGVTICAVYPDVPGREPNRCEPGSGGHSNTRDNDVKVNFTVRVPAGVGFVGRTVNGGVEIDSLQGDAEAHTVNGSVRIAAAGLVRATTVNGSITATGGRTDWTDAAHFKTVNGDIRLTVPAYLNAELRAETVNGSIDTDFPVTVTGTFSPRRMRGTVGSGGQELSLSTVNGSISLMKAR
jgi:Putative adhesin